MSDNWPLKRPMTNKEFNHLVKIFIIRRIPDEGSIEMTQLKKLVGDDMKIAVPKLQLEEPARYTEFKNYVLYVEIAVERMVDSGWLDFVQMELLEWEKPLDFELGWKRGVSKTERTDDFVKYLPITVKRVMEILPTANVTQLIAANVTESTEMDRWDRVRIPRQDPGARRCLIHTPGTRPPASQGNSRCKSLDD